MITLRTDGNVPLSKVTLRMKCARVAQPMNMQVN